MVHHSRIVILNTMQTLETNEKTMKLLTTIFVLLTTLTTFTATAAVDQWGIHPTGNLYVQSDPATTPEGVVIHAWVARTPFHGEQIGLAYTDNACQYVYGGVKSHMAVTYNGEVFQSNVICLKERVAFIFPTAQTNQTKLANMFFNSNVVTIDNIKFSAKGFTAAVKQRYAE